MHHLDSLSESEFIGLFETGERYLSAARSVRAPIRFAVLFLNGGPKSASSVEHAHVQIVAREDRHFAYPELIAARCPIDYWQRLFAEAVCRSGGFHSSRDGPLLCINIRRFPTAASQIHPSRVSSS